MGHKLSGTRFYRVWSAMKQRCYYPKHNRFENYGGRGIKMCDKWLSFDGFYEDMYRSYKAHAKKHSEINTTIDRRDFDGSYSKENCRWITKQEQQQTRSNNHYITYKGITKPLTQWARERGFKRGLLENRVRRGWSVEKMLETPTISKFSH